MLVYYDSRRCIASCASLGLTASESPKAPPPPWRRRRGPASRSDAARPPNRTQHANALGNTNRRLCDSFPKLAASQVVPQDKGKVERRRARRRTQKPMKATSLAISATFYCSTYTPRKREWLKGCQAKRELILMRLHSHKTSTCQYRIGRCQPGKFSYCWLRKRRWHVMGANSEQLV